MISKEELLQKYNLTEDAFVSSSISWEELTQIYEDFKSKRPLYENARNSFLRDYLEDTDRAGIHSYRSRIKDPEHLIAKIIRKRNDAYKKYKALTLNNYEHFLTDLIGFRVFILFKEDWIHFHEYITSQIVNDKHNYITTWTQECPGDNCFIEAPKVHIRTGDKRDIYQTHIHDSDMINRLAGLADEMGSYFRHIKEREIEHLNHLEQEETEPAAPSQPQVHSTEVSADDSFSTPEDMVHALLRE